MITCQDIKRLYKTYRKPIPSVDKLDLQPLLESKQHHIEVNFNSTPELLTIGSIEVGSPFRKIRLERIHAIVSLDKWISIILPCSIIFLNKYSSDVKIHLKPIKPGITEKLKNCLGIFH